MRIVCDENIAITPGLRCLADDLICVPGRAIDRTTVADADALLVRSVTDVDRQLLQGSSVRFVGTATAGCDHIDIPALQSLGIAFAAAPGSNAIAVCEWVLAALAHCKRIPTLLGGGAVGIVGLGAVGRCVARTLNALGAEVLGYDPLTSQLPIGVKPAPLASVLACPIVSLHAALHDDSPFASRHMIQEKDWSVHADQLLLNAGRGGLISRDVLLALHGLGVELALDTWPDEPAIDPALLAATTLATPHIAGYSRAAKIRATTQLVSRLAATAGLEISDDAPRSDEDPAVLNSPAADASTALSDWLIQHYDIGADDQQMRQWADSSGLRGDRFDALRKHYPLRAELSERVVSLNDAQFTLRSLATALNLKPKDGIP